MFRLYSQILGTPVIDQTSGERVARVKELYLNPETGEVLALLTNKSGKVITPVDVVNWDENQIAVNDAAALIGSQEVIKIQEFPIQKLTLLKKIVQTPSKKILGRVHDFVLNTQFLKLDRIYVVKKSFFIPVERRIIGRDEIIEVKTTRIVVKENLAESRENIKDFFALRKELTPSTI